MQAAVMEEMENREQKILLKIKKNLEEITGKLEEIFESFSNKVTSVEEKMSSFEKTIDTKVINLEKSVEDKFVMMDEKINNLQSQRPAPVQIVSGGTGRMKTPCFDGRSPLSGFKFQFETVSISATEPAETDGTMERRLWS